MSDHLGTFEHALYDQPRREMGYCVDDVARVLIVASRQNDSCDEVRRLTTQSLGFLLAAQRADGYIHNRRDEQGRWSDDAALHDWWGRAMWAWGTLVAEGDGDQARVALGCFDRSIHLRPQFIRSLSYGVIGAAHVVSTWSQHQGARDYLLFARDRLKKANDDLSWPWIEDQLTYANAVLPQAMMMSGAVLGDDDLVRQGLESLSWLLERETPHGQFSVTPVGGSRREGTSPTFDQQPIELAAMAEALVVASELDSSPKWRTGLELAAAWFDGKNDGGWVMWNPLTGGGFDGLTAHGPNLNQGAESTTALISTRLAAAGLARSSHPTC